MRKRWELPKPTEAELVRVWGPDIGGGHGQGPEATWWEAEDPSETNFPAKNPFAPENTEQADALSGGRWIGAENPGKRLFLTYQVKVPKTATYDFFVRKFWKHGPFRWRFDEGAWRVCGPDIKLLDGVTLRRFVEANWVDLGNVELASGTHELRVELLDQQGASAFDAFVLALGPFVPRGKLKPGARYGTAPPGWFAFEPDSDDFSETLLDLRRLNERRAGDGGFVHQRGRDLVHETTGQPLRFWATNTGHDVLALPETRMRQYARWLAKLGVNLVRLHGPFWQENDLSAVDPQKLERLHRFESILRDHGIYLGLSIYYVAWIELDQRHGFPGYHGQRPFGLAYFSPKLQELQKSWFHRLLTTPNPHTGTPLATDPALAYVELVNEDSTLFGTFKPHVTIPDPEAGELESKFGAWLGHKYGGVHQALRHWNGASVTGDDPEIGRVGLMHPWDIAHKKGLRAQDTAEFLARLMRDYYADLYGSLRTDLGYRGLIVCSNWRTADARILDPLDKWANAACDVMDRHGYYGGPHRGKAAGYAVRSGDRYDDAAALKFESPDKDKDPTWSLSLPVMDLVVNGKPSFLSELGWTWPNRYRAELPLVAAAYGALQGGDGVMFFASSDPSWAQALQKFCIAEPLIFGQFPAAALVFRRGLVKEAEPVVRVKVSTRELFALKGAPVSAPHAFDVLRLEDVPRGAAIPNKNLRSVDPLAPLVGPVELVIEDGTAPSSVSNIAGLVDRSKRTVRSVTGELLWDYGRGLVTVQAPAVQAVAGFVGSAGRIELADVVFELCQEYGAAWIVALDEKPIAQSRELLLQVSSETSNFGWSAPGTGLRIIKDPGRPPMIVRDLCGRVRLKRGDAASLTVTALDHGGYPRRRARGGAGEIVLLRDGMYYAIEPN